MSTIKRTSIRYSGRSRAAHTIGCGSSTAPTFAKEGALMNARLTRTLLSIVIVLMLTIAYLPANATVIYVDSTAAGGGGTSWADAFNNLQGGLAAAAAAAPCSVWVATGTYYPTSPAGRDATFQLLDDVAIYGGFAGDETSLSERELAANPTTLSGDIGVAGLPADNSYHVVTGSGTNGTAVLDGFTITGGYADIYGIQERGAGMNNISGSPTIVNVVFSDNYADTAGGGMHNEHSSPAVINVVFVGNSTTYGWSGGAGMGNGNSNPTLVNVTFYDNDAGNGYGGGISNYQSNPTLVNTIFWGNTSARGYKEIWNNTSTPTVSYSLVEGGLTPGCIDGGANIDANPLFVDAPSGDLRLHPTSPAVNSGNDAAIPGGISTDLDGNPRIAGLFVDMGAYECPCPSGNRVYVYKDAAGVNDGTSWATAFNELREALEWGPCENVTEIWVAAGTYKPTAGADREATFQLQNGLTIYGGFEGWETTVSERDSLSNRTILSGDIGTEGNDADNSYHVVTGSGTDSTAVLNGFIITGGNADGPGFLGWGGGMYNDGGHATIANVSFAGNYGTYGAGMYNLDSNPTLTNVVFNGNSAFVDGGGMENYRSSPRLFNVVFSGNTAGSEGGAMLNVYVEAVPTLVNVTFTGNTAGDYGGAMLNAYDTRPTLVNTILWGNSAPAGNEIYNKGGPYGDPGVPQISYSLIEGSGGSGAGWDSSLGTDNGGNLDADPLFVDAFAGDLRLFPNSPTVDAGINDSIPSGVSTDLNGDPRIVGGTVDMGAYESQASCPPGTVLYVDGTKTAGANDGTSWHDAFIELRYALEWAPFCSGVSEIWVAKGTYRPTGDTDRTVTFRLLDGVAVYGGFLGTESDRSERDFVSNVTVLSGDIGVPADSTDNSYHVVTGSGTDATAVLDGFTITGGNANEPVLLAALAQAEAYSKTDTKPVPVGAPVIGSRSIAAFTNTHGGGMYNSGGNPTLSNIVFANNYAADGGGMYNDSSSPTLTNVTFSDNSALWGGALHNYDSSNPTLVNVLFTEGSADFGAGIYNNWSNPELVNVTLSNGRAFRGGAIYNNLSHVVLVNAVLWGDSAQSGGHEIYNASATADISYSLVAGSGGSGSWDPSIGTDGGNNIDTDPLFFDGPAGDLRLLPGSQAMDAGNNAASGIPPTDLDGNTRIANGTIDMGAYEFQGLLCPVGTVLYVDSGATGVNDGSSWSDAFTELQTALLYRRCPGVTEIWVVAGTYTPTEGLDRSATFPLASGLAIYGGFAGTETILSERNWVANETILSGDIGVAADDTDNSYHVVTGNGTDSTAVLDGFTITQGNANSSEEDIDIVGGGMITVSGSPTLTNVVFSGNLAEVGAGMFNDGSNPTLTNVLFADNEAGAGGGGMLNVGASSPTLTNVVFSGNLASQGAGMFNISSNPTLTNVIFWRNSAVQAGGIYNLVSSPSLVNVTFSRNTATHSGGGMFNAVSYPTLVNTILWGDSAGTENEIHNQLSTPKVVHSLIEGSGGSGSWDTNLGTDGGGNLDADPLFVDALSGDLRLIPVSPAVDAGINDSIPGGVTTDLNGDLRIVDGTVDMGAYESQALCPPDSILYVDADATGAKNGTSWGDALPELRYALEWAPSCTGVSEIWVAEGTYHPTAGGERDSTFQLPSGIAVYGGFAGGETSVSGRDLAANATILSGDIGTPGVDTDNSYHVVTGSGTDSTAVLDGFTITGGYAEVYGVQDRGAGMLNINSSPTIVNVIISDNYAYTSGGGMSNSYSNPAVINVVFMRNSTTYPWSGGAGMGNGYSNPTLVNVTFYNNDAGGGFGGGMASYESDPTLVNTIFWGNTSAQGYKEINNNASEPTVSHSLIEGGLTPGCIDSLNNIDADPMFVDAPAGNLRLSLGSPAIDVGSNADIPIGVAMDADGNPRIAGGTVDLGAYEYPVVVSAMAFPSPLVFAQVSGNETTCDTIYVVNDGEAMCTIAGISGCTTLPFSLDTTMTTHALALGDTTEIVVCVTPTAEGPDTAQVIIASDAANSPLVVPVRIETVTAVWPDNTPKPFRIVSVSPNPFNPSTTVHFTLPAVMPVTVVVYSVTGARIRLLADRETFGPGDNRLVWDGRTDEGSPAASGVYFVRMETRLGTQVARAVLLK